MQPSGQVHEEKWSLTFVILDSQWLNSSPRLNSCVRMPQNEVLGDFAGRFASGLRPAMRMDDFRKVGLRQLMVPNGSELYLPKTGF
jgi:hypothetical protein